MHKTLGDGHQGGIWHDGRRLLRIDLINLADDTGTNFGFGHIKLSFKHQQATVVECRQFAHAMGIMGCRAMNSRGIHGISILLTGQHVETKRLQSQQRLTIGRIATQRPFVNDPEQLSVGAVGQRLKSQVPPYLLPIDAGYLQLPPRASSIKGIFGHGVVGLSADEQCLRVLTVGNGLAIGVLHAVATKTKIFHLQDFRRQRVELHADEVEAIGRGLV